MNLAIWDIESSSAATDWASIIEIGGVLVDENFKEKDRFNLRCRLPEGEIPQAMALIVNKTSVDQLKNIRDDISNIIEKDTNFAKNEKQT